MFLHVIWKNANINDTHVFLEPGSMMNKIFKTIISIVLRILGMVPLTG